MDWTTEPYHSASLTNLMGEGWKFHKLNGEYDLTLYASCAGHPDRIIKLMRPGFDESELEMILSAHQHVAAAAAEVPVPTIQPVVDKDTIRTILDDSGASRLVWSTSVVPGRCLSELAHLPPSLIDDLGARAGLLCSSLSGFSHRSLHRPLKWRLAQSEWILDHAHLVTNSKDQDVLQPVLDGLPTILQKLSERPRQAIHNDLNDANLFFQKHGDGFCVSGVIDFGDMIEAPVICELAILSAYALMKSDEVTVSLSRLVQHFHAFCPLEAADLSLLWPLVRLRLAVSVINSAMMKQEAPDDPYVVISEAPAWRLLHATSDIDPELINASLRLACGLPVTDAAPDILQWISQQRGQFAPVHGRGLGELPRVSLSVRDASVPRNPFAITSDEAENGVSAEEEAIGLYGEPRLIYSGNAFQNASDKMPSQRTVHLGVDVFLPAGHVVCTPLDAVITHVENRPYERDYGGMVVLEHKTEQGDVFHTLYGHLDPSSLCLRKTGDVLLAGDAFARLGSSEVNGGWKPHLHFQLLLSLAGSRDFWPGVADPDHRTLWQALCPNPAALLNFDDRYCAYQPIPKDERSYFPGNLKLSYRQPLTILRGYGCWLFDEWGRAYLDAYNNVPHVGHCHPRIQSAVAEQLKRLNTNTRYQHPVQKDFAEALIEKAPEGLDVVYLVNSGSEANELAVRLARHFTGAHDIIVQEEAYHGMTNTAVEISPYKFAKPGGTGQKDWVHIIPAPDASRFDEPVQASLDALDSHLEAILHKGSGLCGFIAETFPSVAGQIIPPAGYLQAVYDRIRKAGGVCIADEVQTGLGRLGEHFWGVDAQNVSPDIMVLGKPLGNGHPMGAVLTRRSIAERFANGIEYFSTFGGSTLSCVTGLEVLRIVDDERLQDNALAVGQVLKEKLRELQLKYPCIGDVRGMGLFLGVELVDRPGTCEPATELAGHIVNALRDDRILIGTEGPYDNVLKIRPPLCIKPHEAGWIIESLDRNLELYAKKGAGT